MHNAPGRIAGPRRQMNVWLNFLLKLQPHDEQIKKHAGAARRTGRHRGAKWSIGGGRKISIFSLD
jgi:hypothetical protein